MKKVLSVIISILIVLCLVACDSNKQDESKIRVLVPDFMQSTAKGLSVLTDATQNSPFEDDGVAAGVMSTMPVLSGIKPVEVRSNAVAQDISTFSGSVIYPFGFKVEMKTVKQNSDGLYFYYNIYEGDKWVGYFDYYYNWNTHCFSYREMVVVTTITPNPVIPIPEYNVILFEYDNIKVQDWDTDHPKFVIGLNEAGTEFVSNGYSYQLAINEANGWISCEANCVVLKSDGNMVASIYRPDMCKQKEIEVSAVSTTDDNNIKAFYNAYSTKLVDVGGSKADLNMEESISIISASGFFDDFNTLAERLNTGFSSFGEYSAVSLMHGYFEDLNEMYKTYSHHDLVHDNASVYVIDSKKSASTQFAFKMFGIANEETESPYYKNHYNGTYVNQRPTLILLSNDSDEIYQIESATAVNYSAPFNMFEAIYDTDIETVSHSDSALKEKMFTYQIAVGTAHLKACGFSETSAANYAHNLVYSENEIFFNPGSKHYVTITMTEEPATFKARFIAENTST